MEWWTFSSEELVQGFGPKIVDQRCKESKLLYCWLLFAAKSGIFVFFWGQIYNQEEATNSSGWAGKKKDVVQGYVSKYPDVHCGLEDRKCIPHDLPKCFVCWFWTWSFKIVVGVIWVLDGCSFLQRPVVSAWFFPCILPKRRFVGSMVGSGVVGRFPRTQDYLPSCGSACHIGLTFAAERFPDAGP